MHTPVVIRAQPSTNISPPPHQRPISSISPPLQDQTPCSVVATIQLQPRSGGVRTRGEGAHRRRTRHTSVLRYAPLADINPPPIKETHITPIEMSSTLPIVPFIASPPQPIEVILVDEELVHIANDDQRGQKNDRGRGHG